jgi:cell volume regulation protein A
MHAIDVTNEMLLLGALLVIAGILSSRIATRFGAPILFVFLLIGMLAGEDGPLGIQFSDYRLANLVGALALSVILFDGGLRTRLAGFRGVFAPSLLLATVGVVITAVLGGAFGYWALHLGMAESFLLGAIVASTDAAAVFFLVRMGGLQLRRRVGATLEIESGTNDPVAVFLTMATIGVILAGHASPGAIFLSLIQQGVIGVLVGLLGGAALVALLNRFELPTGLHPLLAIAGAVLVYAAASVGGGSGFFAAYIAGLVLGNRPVRAFASITSLHDAATWLAQIAMFLVLGLLATPHNLIPIALPALGLSLFLIFVARPIAVWICLIGFGYDTRAKLFVSWVGLRGAVSIFLAVVPKLAGLPHADIYFDTAFFVVIVSLLLQGWTTKWVALRLGQALPRKTAPVTRVELDLPGQLDLEMVGYPIGADSRVLTVSTLPAWVKPALVVRGGRVLEPAQAGALMAGDYAYFLSPPLRVMSLDKLFASTKERHSEEAMDSEFPIRGDAPLARLNELYDLALTNIRGDQTVAGLFAEQFETAPQVGDTIPLGKCLLIVRALDDDGVARAGLQLEEDRLANATLWQRARELFRPH